MCLVILADPANAVVAQEFLLVEHVLEQILQISPTHQGEHHDIFIRACLECVLPACNQAIYIGTVLTEPAQTCIKKSFPYFGWKRLHGQQWNEPDQRAHL